MKPATAKLVRFSPRAWGWSEDMAPPGKIWGVLPTCVGMVRVEAEDEGENKGSPHVRGDGPCSVSCVMGFGLVLPTCVGMVRD